MEQLIGIPICAVKYLVGNDPLGSLLIGLALVAYYFSTRQIVRFIVRKMAGKTAAENIGEKIGSLNMPSPQEAYEEPQKFISGQVRFGLLAAELVVVLLSLVNLASYVGLLSIDLSYLESLCMRPPAY